MHDLTLSRYSAPLWITAGGCTLDWIPHPAHAQVLAVLPLLTLYLSALKRHGRWLRGEQ
jgi:hypothetical protein